MIDIFIPSYHRWDNLKTVKYFTKIGWEPKNIHVLIDDEADDALEYEAVCKKYGVNFHVFSQEEARSRYDYVHRPSVSRRSAGQAHNMCFDLADKVGVNFYVMQDDDTEGYQIKVLGKYVRMATFNDIYNVFEHIKKFMLRRKIGLFGLSQTGDILGGYSDKLLRNKVMNTTFVNTDYIYRGERGVLDVDTSQFVGVMNEGYFTGSVGDGLILQQTSSATSGGGLTDLYNEVRLLHKSLVTPIQFPSAIHAEKQEMNGGRLHHRVNYRYLYPKILKTGGVDNIAWDTYPEDGKFTNEPKRYN